MTKSALQLFSNKLRFSASFNKHVLTDSYFLFIEDLHGSFAKRKTEENSELYYHSDDESFGISKIS